MARFLAFAYGVGAYGIFFLTFLYLIGFLANVYVPKGIDDGLQGPASTAFAINLALIALFGVQHSVMARPAFKKWLTQWISPAVERSTFVLASSLVLILLYWQWRPLDAVVWQFSSELGSTIALAMFCLGFLLVLASTFIISHFDLFGLKQVTLNLMNKPYDHPQFKVTWFYKFIRHPLYLGFIIAFWSTPTMTVGHLLFALAMTGYIFIGIHYEERDLKHFLGEDYRSYAEKVPMLLPVARPHETRRPRKEMAT